MASLNPKRFQNLSALAARSNLQWRRKLLVFSFFLLLSVIIWLLNALSKDYTTEIRYPITYTSFPEKKVLVSDLPDYLWLNVSARGYSLLIYKLSNRPVPINFRVSAYAMNSFPGDTNRFYLLTRFAREPISRQMPADLQLNGLAPDTLVFHFANQARKKIPVTPRLEFELDRDYTLVDGLVVDPDSIWIEGPDIILDTLSGIYTEQKSLGLIRKGHQLKLTLVQKKHLDYGKKEINCRLDLEKVTAFQMQVPVHVKALPDSLGIQTFPQKIRISGKVGLSKYDRLVPELFRAEANYSDVIENKTRLSVSVEQRPDFIIDMEYYPQSIEYLLTVK